MKNTEKTELRDVAIGTDIRNIKREVCYRIEYGFGVLSNKEA